jgi:guanine deaminase
LVRLKMLGKVVKSTSNYLDYFEIACAEAEQGMLAGQGGPFGAVVVKDDKVIARGHNQVISSHDSTAHAEITAIRQAEQALGTHDLSGCEIYTTCYPCPMCLGAIMWARIPTVHYGCTADEAAEIGFDDSAFYEALASPVSNKLVTMERSNSRQCRALFKKWLELDNRVTY